MNWTKHRFWCVCCSNDSWKGRRINCVSHKVLPEQDIVHLLIQASCWERQSPQTLSVPVRPHQPCQEHTAPTALHLGRFSGWSAVRHLEGWQLSLQGQKLGLRNIYYKRGGFPALHCSSAATQTRWMHAAQPHHTTLLRGPRRQIKPCAWSWSLGLWPPSTGSQLTAL